MKTKKILKFIVFLLILIGCFVSCEKTNTFEKVIESVSPNDNLIIFLDTRLPEVSGSSMSECFFVDHRSDTCIIINNMDELINQMSCLVDIVPNIDFEKQTLIIGQHLMPQMYYTVVEQNIVETETLLKLNLTVQRSEGTYEAFSTMYYWGIYPKLPDKNIKVNIINN